MRWGDVLLSAIAAVSWALVGMAGTAALGLHLLGADAIAALGPMTAATVALGAGGSVTPSGDVSAFGLDSAEATTTVDIAPLGVGLVGALFLAHFFLRSLRAAGAVIAPGELAARAAAVVALFVAMLAGLAWAGHDVITIDGKQLGIDKGIEEGIDGLPDGIGDKLPGGIGDDIGGLLPDRLGDLVEAEASVGFTVDTGPTLLGGAVWVTGVLLVALLASRRTPLPRALGGLHRVVRPAVSALVTVVLVAVAAGFAAAAYAMVGDDHPERIAGAALLGAPNGVWLGLSVGLFVPWDGTATGELRRFLPDPVDDLLTGPSDKALTLGRLAELDDRVWLLGVAAAVTMVFAGVLTAVRTPYIRDIRGVDAVRGVAGVGVTAGASEVGEVRAKASAPGFVGLCGVRLGVVTAVGLPLLAWLSEVSADASLSVFGFDAFGAGVELHGRLGMAVLLGAVWGLGAGLAGALLAVAAGAAGGGASRFALASTQPGTTGPSTTSGASGASGTSSTSGTSGAGPYTPGTPHRPPNPDTNPYLRPPPSAPRDDVSGAPTVMGPMVPPPPPPRRRSRSTDWPPPPPPPPPPPKTPRKPN